MAPRVLGYTVPVHRDDLPSLVFPAGTREDEIPEEYLAAITNPKAWLASPVAPDPHAAPEPFVYRENDSAPNSIDECSLDELIEIATREQIPLGRLKDTEKIREVVREALGIEGGDDGTGGS